MVVNILNLIVDLFPLFISIINPEVKQNMNAITITKPDSEPNSIFPVISKILKIKIIKNEKQLLLNIFFIIIIPPLYI